MSVADPSVDETSSQEQQADTTAAGTASVDSAPAASPQVDADPAPTTVADDDSATAASSSVGIGETPAAPLADGEPQASVSVPAAPAKPAPTPVPAPPDAPADLLERLDALEKRQAATEQRIRDSYLAQLGVLEKYRRFAPDVDASTEKGRLELERWVSQNQELAPNQRPSYPEPDWSKMGDRVAFGPDNGELAKILADVSRKDWVM